MGKQARQVLTSYVCGDGLGNKLCSDVMHAPGDTVGLGSCPQLHGYADMYIRDFESCKDVPIHVSMGPSVHTSLPTTVNATTIIVSRFLQVFAYGCDTLGALHTQNQEPIHQHRCAPFCFRASPPPGSSSCSHICHCSQTTCHCSPKPCAFSRATSSRSLSLASLA
jgi:hypothetical protein